jgi:DNA polymerase II large subunit
MGGILGGGLWGPLRPSTPRYRFRCDRCKVTYRRGANLGSCPRCKGKVRYLGKVTARRKG